MTTPAHDETLGLLFCRCAACVAKLEAEAKRIRANRDTPAVYTCVYHDHDPQDECHCEGEAWAGGDLMSLAEARGAAEDHVGFRHEDGTVVARCMVSAPDLSVGRSAGRMDFYCDQDDA